MLETSEAGRPRPGEPAPAAVDPVAQLREDLLAAQFELGRSKRFAVLILVSGPEGSGRGEALNLLTEWLDSRHVHAHALGDPTSEEADRPPMWWAWRRLPAKGEIAVFFRAWGSREVFEDSSMSDADRMRRIGEIAHFERMLAAEGVLVLNFYFHLSKKQQRKRLERLERDPRSAWRVTKDTWRALEKYEQSRETRARVLGMLDRPETPWFPIEGANPRACAISLARVLLDAVTRRLAASDGPPAPRPAGAAVAAVPARLATLDMAPAFDAREIPRRLVRAQERFALSVQKKRFRKARSLIIVFEGADAAGKGGAIRRITQALDARQYETFPIAAPTDEERGQPYLWRFWRRIPGHGRVAIFDRSWYGRVLVERVEGFCREADWQRAYGEIVDFEAQLVAAGAIVVKLWLQISKEEQLARFEQREKTGFKRYKITPEDWRNREKWDDYQRAADEMFERTGTRGAPPWDLVAANDKQYARATVLETICERLEDAL